MLREFLQHQMMKPVSATPGRQSKAVMNPASKMKTMEDNSFESIVAKKPKAKKVRKYLQGLIDEIVAENDL